MPPVARPLAGSVAGDVGGAADWARVCAHREAGASAAALLVVVVAAVVVVVVVLAEGVVVKNRVPMARQRTSRSLASGAMRPAAASRGVVCSWRPQPRQLGPGASRAASPKATHSRGAQAGFRAQRIYP
jgi:hypothetical protein